MNGVVCIIPARLGSTRLHRKPLVDIGGLPLVVHTLRQARSSKAFERCIVATDSDEIAVVVRRHGGEALLTSPCHPSGTDRVLEAATMVTATYVVNLQGDEPDVPHTVLNDFAAMVVSQANENCLITSVTDATIDEVESPDCVKVVLNVRDEALYFSRAPIPCSRDGGTVRYWKHTGMYGFSIEGLKRFCSFGPGMLENIEKLEQLRALENAMTITCLKQTCRTHAIDTPADLARFQRHVERTRKADSATADTQ